MAVLVGEIFKFSAKKPAALGCIAISWAGGLEPVGLAIKSVMLVFVVRGDSDRG
jgi:hypothetical protein